MKRNFHHCEPKKSHYMQNGQELGSGGGDGSDEVAITYVFCLLTIFLCVIRDVDSLDLSVLSSSLE